MIKFYEIQNDQLPIFTPAITSFDNLPPNSIYSIFRTFDSNKFLYLEEHLARTHRSTVRLGWQRLDESLLRRAIHAVCVSNKPDVRVRFDFWENGRLTLAIIPFTPPPISFYTDGVQVMTAAGINRHDPLDKTAAFIQTRAHYRQTHEDMYEFLLVSGDAILEGFSSNFYGVRDGVLYTAEEGVLEGITRRILLELMSALNIHFVLEAVKLADLPSLDEAAMSSSSRGLLPIVEINGRSVGNDGLANGRPGSITKKLMKAYDEFVREMVKTAV